MSAGEFLTRGTVWTALLCYTVVELVRLSKPRNASASRALPWLWMFGCLSYLAHVVAAFHFYHGWSHAKAYAETARQTNALLGFNWGGGLFFNYAFTGVWLVDLAWCWIEPDSYQSRPRWLEAILRGFFLFMIVNATVIFGRGAARVLGAVIVLLLVIAWSFGQNRTNRSSANARG